MAGDRTRKMYGWVPWFARRNRACGRVRSRVCYGMPTRLRSAFFLSVAGFFPLTARAQVRPLKIEDAIGAYNIQTQSLLGVISPDGRFVAHTVCDPQRARRDSADNGADTKNSPYFSVGCDLHVTSLADKSTRKIVSAKGGNWAPAWSPNSAMLAFESDRDGSPLVYVWEEKTAKVRKVSDVSTRSRFGFERPLWTPDSKQLVVKLFPQGFTQEQLELSNSGGAPVTDKVAGSTLVFYQTLPASAAQPPAPPSAAAARNFMMGDLSVIDVATGKIKRLAQYAGAWFGISPDGKHVAYLDVTGDRMDPTRIGLSTNLTVIDLAGGVPRTLTKSVVQTFTGAINWSPDSKWIAYTNKAPIDMARVRAGATISSPNGANTQDADLYVIAAAGGEPKKFSGEGLLSGAFNSTFMAPLWNASSTELVAVGDGKLWRANVASGLAKLIPVSVPLRELVRGGDERTWWTNDGGASAIALTIDQQSMRSAYVKIDLTSGKTQTLFGGLKRIGRVFEAPFTSRDGRTIVFLAESGSESADLWSAGPDMKEPKRFTSMNPLLEGYTFGASKLIEFTSSDSAPLRGSLLLPAGYQEGKRYPLIVWVYASDEGSRNVNSFGLIGISAYNLHMFTTRGYAVLWPDMPVKVGTPMKDMMKSVMPAIDRVVEMGIADSNRLAVMGQSGGGYSTLSLIAQTNRFKAAVMSSGYGDLTAVWGSMSPVDGSGGWHPWLEQMGGAMGGPPWEQQQRYVDNSPIYILNKITTPLIIEAGGNDVSIVPYSDEVYVGMKRLKKDVTYLRYKGEGHVLTQYPNLIDYWNRVTKFLDERVKNPQLRQ